MSRAAIYLCAAAAAAVVAAACREGPTGAGDPPATLTVEYVLPSSPDPSDGVDAWRAIVISNGTVVVDREFASGEPIEIGPIDPAPSVVLVLEGCDSDGCGSVLARGRTLPFELTGEDQTVRMYFGRTGTFNVPTGSFTPREGLMAGHAGSRVVIAGGSDGGTPGTLVELYDPDTDTIAAGPALPAAQSRGAAIRLDANTLLFAGGLDDSNEASDAAHVWTGAAWAGGVPSMSERRLDAAGAPLGRGRAVMVGGTNGNIMRDDSEIFTWTGTTGSWIDGPDFAEPVIGACAIPVGEGRVAVVGGYTLNSDGDNEFLNDAMLLTSNGGWQLTDLVNLDNRRGFAAAIPAAPNVWLLAGGLRGGVPGAPTDTTERLTWNGTDFAHAGGPDLNIAGRYGGVGVLFDGTPLLVGGDTSPLNSPLAPIVRAETYDATGNDFIEITSSSPGVSTTGWVFPLADGTAVVVTDAGVFRYVPE